MRHTPSPSCKWLQLRRKEKPAAMNVRHPWFVVATFLWVGRIPVAPGTFGSLAALPLAWVLAYMGGWPLLLAGVVALTAIGVPATAWVERNGKVKDASLIVIDEVAAMCLAVLLLPTSGPLWWLGWVTAFVLFRVFDILKPWPAGWVERRKKNAWDVMLDDLIAGGYALLGTMVLLPYLRQLFI